MYSINGHGNGIEFIQIRNRNLHEIASGVYGNRHEEIDVHGNNGRHTEVDY